MLDNMIPRSSVNSIYEIDLATLRQRGVKGIITDLDNTLVGAKAAEPTERLAAWLREVAEMGCRVVIVSNNNEARVSSFAAKLAIPFLSKARKPTRRSFRKALAIMGLRADQAVVVGDQLLTDILGGNRMGLYTILVRPVDRSTDGMLTRINRRVEGIVLAALKKKGYTPWEDS